MSDAVLVALRIRLHNLEQEEEKAEINLEASHKNLRRLLEEVKSAERIQGHRALEMTDLRAMIESLGGDL